MDEFKKPYLIAFNGITDALEVIDRDPQQAKLILMRAQQEAEAVYIENK